jgi:malonyl-CoA/methylmalonyl-CoA synthetase
MTEIGMALSNPLRGERRAVQKSLSAWIRTDVQQGTVGLPLPGVSVRVVDENGADATTGDLRVRGPSVFNECVCPLPQT